MFFFFHIIFFIDLHQTCLCKRTRYGVTPEEDSTSLKKVKLESATQELIELEEEIGKLHLDIIGLSKVRRSGGGHDNHKFR